MCVPLHCARAVAEWHADLSEREARYMTYCINNNVTDKLANIIAGALNFDNPGDRVRQNRALVRAVARSQDEVRTRKRLTPPTSCHHAPSTLPTPSSAHP